MTKERIRSQNIWYLLPQEIPSTRFVLKRCYIDVVGLMTNHFFYASAATVSRTHWKAAIKPLIWIFSDVPADKLYLHKKKRFYSCLQSNLYSAFEMFTTKQHKTVLAFQVTNFKVDKLEKDLMTFLFYILLYWFIF